MQISRIDANQFGIWREQIEDLFNRSVQLNFPGYPIEPTYGKKKCDEVETFLKEGSAIVFVAFDKDTLLGWVWCHQIFRLTRKRLHLAEIAVNDIHRKCGIGKALLNRIETFAEEHGYQEIDLLVTKSNEAAVAFYENASYETERYLMRKAVISQKQEFHGGEEC